MSDEATTEQYHRELRCYKDVKEAEAVCGECGRPVCGPVLTGTLRELAKSAFDDYGHGRRFHDSRFYQYEAGLNRTLLVIGLAGVAILFRVILPNVVPGQIWAMLPISTFFNTAIAHSAAILAIAFALTLRYQSGEHTTDFQILVRRTTSRIVCDDCFEDALGQLILYYIVTAVAIVLVGFGIWRIATDFVALPLRIVALGVGLLILRDDFVAYAMELLDTGDTRASSDTTASSEAE